MTPRPKHWPFIAMSVGALIATLSCSDDVCEWGAADVLVDVDPALREQLSPLMLSGPCFMWESSVCVPNTGYACLGYGIGGREVGTCTVQFLHRNGDEAGQIAYFGTFKFGHTAGCCSETVCSELPRGNRRISVP